MLTLCQSAYSLPQGVSMEQLKAFIRDGITDEDLQESEISQEEIDRAKEEIDQENLELTLKESKELEEAVTHSKLSELGVGDFKRGYDLAEPYSENQSRPTRTDKNQNKYYSYNVIGDGDCGLHALNTTRLKAKKAVENAIETNMYPNLQEDLISAQGRLNIPNEHLENRDIALIGFLQGSNVFVYDGSIPGFVDHITEDNNARSGIPELEGAPKLRIINESVDENEQPREIASDAQGGHFRILASIDDKKMQAYGKSKEKLIPSPSVED